MTLPISTIVTNQNHERPPLCDLRASVPPWLDRTSRYRVAATWFAPHSLTTEAQRHRDSTEKGVTIVEFALVLPVLILFVLAFIDLVRVIAVQGILTHAAEQTLEVAVTMPNFDVDIRSAIPASAEYQRFLLARSRIIQDATKLPLQTLLSDSANDSTAQLVKFTYEDPAQGGVVPIPFSADVAILRPGEQVKIGDAASTMMFNHETYPFPGAGVTEPKLDRLMRSQPIIVEMRAKIFTFTPILGDIYAKGVAQGFRDPIPRGPMPDEVLNTGTVVTPWPSATPSPTNYPYADPTPTPLRGTCNAPKTQWVFAKDSWFASLPDLTSNQPLCQPDVKLRLGT